MSHPASRPRARLLASLALLASLLASLLAPAPPARASAPRDLFVADRDTHSVQRFDWATGAAKGAFIASPALGNPSEIARGPDGDLYVADSETGRVVRYDGASAAVRRVYLLGGPNNGPSAIAVAGAYLYAVFGGPAIIRVDTATGANLGAINGPSGNGLVSPEALAVGPDGYLYAGDGNDGSVRRFDPASGALVDTFIAPGSGGLGRPSSIVFGGGYIYVSDFTTRQILRYSQADGSFDRLFASTDYSFNIAYAGGKIFAVDGGPEQAVLRYDAASGALEARLRAPYTPAAIVAGADGALYLTVNALDSVLRIDPAGVELPRFFVAGRPAYAIEESAVGADGLLYATIRDAKVVARFDRATGAARDLFVTDHRLGYAELLAFGPAGDLFTSAPLAGSIERFSGADGSYLGGFVPAGSGGLGRTFGMVFQGGSLYVGDFFNDRVLRYNASTGAFVSVFVAAGSGGLSRPYGLTFGPDGLLYVSSSSSNQVLRYNASTGAFVSAFVAAGAGGLSQPRDLIFGPDGALHVVSVRRVLRYNGSTGAALSPYSTTFGDAVDLTVAGGELLVSDVVRGEVFRFSSAGALLGLDLAYSGDDLLNPQGFTLGPDGDFYLTSFRLGGPIYRYDGTTGAFRGYFSRGAGGWGLSSLAFAPNGDLYATTRNGPSVLRFDGDTGAYLGSLGTPSASSASADLAIDPAGVIYAPARTTGELRRFDSATGAALSSLFPGATMEAVEHRDGVLYLSTSSGEITRRNPGTGASLGLIAFAAGQVRDLAFSPDLASTLFVSRESGPVVSYPTAGGAPTDVTPFGAPTHGRIVFANANRPPTIALAAAPAAFAEGGPPALLDPAATLSDPESLDFSGGALTVSVVSGGSPADRLGVRDEGAGPGQIGRSGADVTFGGVTIGSLSGGAGAPLVISLNAAATPAAAQALLRNVTFAVDSDDPGAASRTIRVTLSDGDGATSAPAERQVAVSPVNDAPAIAGAADLTLGEAAVNAGPQRLFPAATIADPDSPDFAGGSLRVGLGAAATADDLLGLGEFGGVTRAGATVSVGGVAVGTAPGSGPGSGAGGAELTISLNAEATPARVGALLAALTFASPADAPPAPRALRVELADGDGGTSLITPQLTVTPANDPPAVAAGQSFSLAENSPAGSSLGALAASDPDGPTTLQGWAIEGGNEGGAFALDAASGALRVASPAALDREARAGFTLLVSVSDGQNRSAAAAVAVTLSDVNEPPQISGLGGDQASFTEGGGPVALDQAPAAAVLDLDSPGLAGGSLRLALTGGLPEDRLTILSAGGVSRSGDELLVDGVAVGTASGGAGSALEIALGAGATPARVARLIGALAYDSAAGDTPTAGTRGLLLTLDDGGEPAGVVEASLSVAVAAANDPPVISAPASIAVTEDSAGPLTGIALSDPDAGAGALELSLGVDAGALSATGAAGVAVEGSGAALSLTGSAAAINALLAAGELRYTPPADSVAGATLTLRADDQGNSGGPAARSPEASLALTVTPVNDPPTLDPIADQAAGDSGGLLLVDLAGLSAGPGDESGQALTVSAASDNPDLVAGVAVDYSGPAPTGSLTISLAEGVSGVATVTVTVADDGGTAGGGVDRLERSFLLFVGAVNRRPTLDQPADLTIGEDAGQRAVALSGLGPGRPEEAGQQLTLSAASDNPALIPAPAVVYSSPQSSAELRLAPAANRSGVATITVTLADDGGTANGGVDRVVRSFTVTVTPVNDAPSFTAGPGQTVVGDGVARSLAGWAGGFVPGPADEAGQALLGYSVVANSAPGLFAAGPAISPDGRLSFTPRDGAAGVATIRVVARDDGGTANGGVDRSAPRQFTIRVEARPEPGEDGYRLYLPSLSGAR